MTAPIPLDEELLDFFAQGRRIFGPKIRGWIGLHGLEAPFRFPADPTWRRQPARRIPLQTSANAKQHR